MKKIRSLTIVITALLLTTGCSKNFLKEGDIDKVKPTTTDALSQLLVGEGYPIDIAFHAYAELLTDDVQANYTNLSAYSSLLGAYTPAFTWQPEMFDKLRELAANGTSTYENYYQKIKGCNVILDYVDHVSGSEADKQNLKGQALALRAFYYFTLVNFYGKPYGVTGTNPDTDPGVPLILSAAVTDVSVPRASIAKVYQQIETDLLAAIDLLPPMGNNSIYRINKTSAALLASRFYLYKNDWNKSIQYADMVIAAAPVLKDLNTASGLYFGVSNPVLAGNEVLWAYGATADYNVLGKSPGSDGKAPYTVSDDLLASYDVNDLRTNFYLSQLVFLSNTLNIYKAGSGKANNAGTAASGNITTKAFRISEAYLNRAEARIQLAVKGDASGIPAALTDINTLRRARIKAAAYQDINITDPAALLTFYKAERRRELCFEDHRWFDLRRWGMPELVHHLQTDALDETFRLNAGDARYTLQFSKDILLRNPNLVQNP